MHHRFLKICVLLLSLSLTVLPLRMAFAASAMPVPASAGAAHCQDMNTDDHAEAIVLSPISNHASCSECDTSCATSCSIVGAIISAPSIGLNDVVPAAYEQLLTGFTKHSTAPPSPPPLS